MQDLTLARAELSSETCRSLPACTFFVNRSPHRGPFPPSRPRLRVRWFRQVLSMLDRCKCVHRAGLQNPRTLKRRNSPYGSHNRRAPRNVPMDITASLLGPLAVPKREIYKKNI